MKPEEFENTTKNILTNLEDQGKVSQSLLQLNEQYKTYYTTNQTLQDKQKEYEKEIQGLKDTNMNLFLKLQSTPPANTAGAGNTDEKPLTYDDLIKGMGV